MSKMLAIVLMLSLIIAACGGDDDDDNGAVTNIEDAETCEQVADIAIAEIQNLLDAVSNLTMADLMSEDEPEALTNFETEFEAIGDKADEIGCSDEEMQGLFEDRVDSLTAEGPVGELLLQGLQTELVSGE